MKRIQLTRGKVALVDDVDYRALSHRKWYARPNWYTFYAVCRTRLGTNKYGHEYMHRMILGLKRGDGRQTDHRDGNGLNNQGSNLRICTAIQNGQSVGKRRAGRSKYKGVFRGCHKWRSRIRVNGTPINLGSFDLEINAAQAYDAAALKHHRQFALTNKMLGLL